MKTKILAAITLFIAVVSVPIAVNTNTLYAAETQDCTEFTNVRQIEECELRNAATEDPALACSYDSQNDDDDGSCNLYKKYINPLITFLSALVGIAVTIGLIIGGIRYSTAGSDTAQVTAARKQIKNSLVALIVFLFLGTLLNWLVPGGIL